MIEWTFSKASIASFTPSIFVITSSYVIVSSFRLRSERALFIMK